MVDFRYHLVSIIAVFLALAVGIVVGTTALNGPALDGLKGSISRLTTDKRSLESSVKDLRSTVADDGAFADLVAPALLRDRLVNERVLVVSTSDAPTTLRDGLLAALKTAGATVSGQLRLRPDLTDPAKATTVGALATGAAPAQLSLPEGTPLERAAAELAAVLVRRPGTAVSSVGSTEQVLAAFTGADLLDLESSKVDPSASLVLVVTGPVPTGPTDAEPGLLTLLEAFDARAGVVVTGPTGSADPQGLLRSLRTGPRASRVTTVDDVDRGQGRVAAVLALHEQSTGGRGRYGTGPGAQATTPSPTP